jgi:hypothetical protein
VKSQLYVWQNKHAFWSDGKFSTIVGIKTQNLYLVSANRYRMTVVMCKLWPCSCLLCAQTYFSRQLNTRVLESQFFSQKSHWKCVYLNRDVFSGKLISEHKLALLRPPPNFAV